MVEIPAGAFMMGCNSSVDGDCYSDEYPYHQVTLSAFYIDIYEVTAGEYEECVNADGCSYNGTTSRIDRTYQNNKDDHPINYVNWFEAKTYCEWKNKRLPTEAEWEKAARGTDGRLYPWGNQAASCSYALMDDGGDGCGTNLTAPVGSKPAGASIYGVMDMSGSVWELVS